MIANRATCPLSNPVVMVRLASQVLRAGAERVALSLPSVTLRLAPPAA